MSQVRAAYRRFCLLTLERTFASLPLSQVAKHDPFGALSATPKNPHISVTASLLFEMIASGDLDAVISRPQTSTSSTASADLIVRFEKPISRESSPLAEQQRQLIALNAQIERIVELNNRIKAQDRKIGLTKEYTIHALKARAKEAASTALAGSSSAGGAGAGGRSAGREVGSSSSGGHGPGGSRALASDRVEFMDLDEEDLMESWR